MNQYNLDIYLENIDSEDQMNNFSEFQWGTWLTTWFNNLDLDLAKDYTYEINLRFTDDEEIQNLNRQFRYQDKPTDVLSFAALEDDFPQIEELNAIALGDIIISLETAAKQAQEENHSLETELVWLACHGLLHLLGWDHPDDESLEEMMSLQRQLLQKIGFEHK